MGGIGPRPLGRIERDSRLMGPSASPASSGRHSGEPSEHPVRAASGAVHPDGPRSPASWPLGGRFEPCRRSVDGQARGGERTRGHPQLLGRQFSSSSGASTDSYASWVRVGSSTSRSITRTVWSGSSTPVRWASRTVVELDDRVHHGDDRFQSDTTRDERLVALGFVVIRLTWDDVTRRSGAILKRIASTVASRTRPDPPAHAGALHLGRNGVSIAA